jgi:hypothetical protein
VSCITTAKASRKTFKQGTILKLSSGNLVAGDTADPWSAADVVFGVSAEPAHNLTTANTAEPAVSAGTPPNQASAKIIPVGAWNADGTIMYYRANGVNVFAISLASGQTFAQANIVAGSYYALKYDSTTKYWYLDNTDTTGNNAVAEIVGPLSDDTSWVAFRFKASQRYWD